MRTGCALVDAVAAEVVAADSDGLARGHVQADGARARSLLRVRPRCSLACSRTHLFCSHA